MAWRRAPGRRQFDAQRHAVEAGTHVGDRRRVVVGQLEAGVRLEGLPAGGRSWRRRETASSVLVVARGAGTLACGDQALDLQPSDVAAVPAWTWHQLTARDGDLVVFRVTDRPVHEAFGLYHAETGPA